MRLPHERENRVSAVASRQAERLITQLAKKAHETFVQFLAVLDRLVVLRHFVLVAQRRLKYFGD